MAKNLVSGKAEEEYIKHKIQTQNMIILALAIVIVVLIVVSSTAAWYIRTRSDSADLYLSNPVNIYITEFDDKDGDGYMDHTVKQDILEGYNTRIYPGDRIKLRLGVQIGSEEEMSSPAYVRVKLSMSFSKISDDPDEPDISMQEMADEGLIEYQNEPDSQVWEKIDFNRFVEGEHDPDYWYVLKTVDNGQTVARTANNMEQLVFVDGFIKLSKLNITNKYANCYFHINYTVEAIQIPHVPDPIVNPGYGPWWDFVLGDEEDL